MSVFSGCTYFVKEPDNGTRKIARVGNEYLYEEDIMSVVSDGLSAEDSTLLVTNFINSWAASQLLVSKARINLSEDKLMTFDKLVQAYQRDLYINAYKEALVSKSVDTVVTQKEMQRYYAENKENFKLNEELLKLKYIHLPSEYSDKEKLVTHFLNTEEEDMAYIDSLSIQFKSYNMNDSVWVRYAQLANKIPHFNSENKSKYLKKSQFFELEDSLGVYLVKIKDVLLRNENAPLSYIEPTIHQIIINQRKMEFIRNLESDILEEATKSSEFEVYDE